jgi:hypothetical protein
MVKSTFPVDEARPLIAIPKDIPQIGFLGGEQGKEIETSIKKDYKDFSVMQVGNYSNNIIKGSNPFYAVGVQSKLPFGVRVSTQSDLENAMRIGALNFSGTYEDTGLVLRTNGDPNSYLAENLMKQVKDRLGKEAKMMPVMIPLYGMGLVKDQDSPHGLAFKLKEDAQIIYAPILKKSSGSNFNSEDIDAKTGLPTKVGKGNRTLWTRDSGLSRLCLGRNLYLSSCDDDLADSYDIGRVVLVSTAEGGSQAFFDEKLTELQKIKDEKIAKINEDYIKAEKILRG